MSLLTRSKTEFAPPIGKDMNAAIVPVAAASGMAKYPGIYGTICVSAFRAIRRQTDCSMAAGIVTVISNPCGARLTAEIVPPCTAMARLAIAKPRPKP